jgi:hypothetical protein
MCPSVENGRLESFKPENASIVEPKKRVFAADFGNIPDAKKYAAFSA